MELTRGRTGQLLLVIVLLGAVLRFWSLGNNSFVADEFLDINSSYGYHQTGEWKAWDFNYGRLAEMNVNDARDERAFVYKIQVALLFSFLPPTETVARSVSALWGVFAILVVYWSSLIFTRRRDIGLVAAALCAISISAIIFSRRLRMYAMFFPVYLAFATSAYAFYEVEYQGRIALFRKWWERFGLNFLYLFPVLALGVLALSVHQLAANLPLALGVYLFAMFLLTWRETGTWKNKYGYSVGLGLLGLFGTLLFLPQYVRAFTRELVFFEDHFGYFGHVLADFATPVIGVLLVSSGVWYLLRREKQRQAALYLVTALLVPLLMAVFMWKRNVGPQYIFFAQSFVMILAAAGIVGLFTLVRERMADIWSRRFWAIFVLVLALLIPNLGYFFQENNTYHETSAGDNPNYRKVFAYFKKEKVVDDVLITRNFRNYYWSGAEVPVYDFGGELSESKFSLAELQAIQAKHPHGWFIYSGNDQDYISSDVEVYVSKYLERVSNASVRGDVSVYRWGHTSLVE